MRLGVYKLLYILFFVFGTLFFATSASAATVYVNSSTGDDSTGDGSSGTPYKTFHKGYTEASADDTLNLTGTFTWDDADETGDASTSGYTLGKNLTIIGQRADQTIIQSESTTQTADRRVFTISSDVTIHLENLTIRNGRISGSGNGGGILNSGTLTITNSFISSNRTTGGSGGGISNLHLLTITSSTINNNLSYYNGGGLSNAYYVTDAGYMTITNCTIAYNEQTSTVAYTEGGGVHFRQGSGTITNTTIAYNTATGVAGLGIDDSSGTLTLKNNIIANNIDRSNSNYVDFGFRSSGQGNVVDNGYNIVGNSQQYTFTTTTAWTDQSRTGTFTLYSIGTTGSLNLDSTLAVNDNPNRITNLALSASSIAINNAGTGSNGATSTVPNVDQRGATRAGGTDIGAYEYDGGLTISAPATQASSLVFSSVQYDQMTLGWTNGDGSKRVVFIKQASTGTATPVDGTTYTASTTFGGGTQIGSSGWYAVYNGVATSTTILGLQSNTIYIAQVFEYNGVATDASDYFTDTATDNPETETTYNPITIYINSSSGDDDTGDGTSSAPYKSFHTGYTTSSPGDTLNLTGTFTWTDAAETGDSSTTGYTIGKDLTITGQRADQTIIQAHSSDDSADRRVFTISSGVSSTIQNVAIRYGKITASSADGGGIRNEGDLKLTNCEIYSNRATGDTGGGVSNRDTLFVNRCAVYSNVTKYSGGGLSNNYYTVGEMHISNSTIAYNEQTSTVAYTEGGGVHYRQGSGTITNTTIAYNTAGSVGGLGIDDSSGTLTLKNNLIVNNIKRSSSSYVDFGYRSSGQGNVVDNGYNIVGVSQNYTFVSSTDWTDQSRTDTFTLYDIGTTGTLNISSTLAVATSLYYTKTLALLEDSIAINRGTTGTNGTRSVPTADQRGASHTGAPDVGAYEYNGGIDVTEPTLSSHVETPTADGAVIEWASDESASSQIEYGINDSYGRTTTEVNTESGVTSHSITLEDLKPCALFHYRTLSNDLFSNQALGSDRTFTSSGCPGSASILASESSSVTTSTGSSMSLVEGTANLDLTIPAGYSTTTAQFQMLQLTDTAVISGIGKPTNFLTASNHVYNLLALSDVDSSITNFDSALTITITYTEAEISGLDEETLEIQSHDGSSWSELSGCTVDTAGNSVTCSTTHFSTFGLFGTAVSTSGGGSTLPVSSKGGGSETKFLGEISEEGKNVLLYMDSKADFYTLDNNETKKDAVLKIDHLNLLTNVAAITIKDVHTEIKLGETLEFDIDEDEVNDIQVIFTDLFINRLDITIKKIAEQVNIVLLPVEIFVETLVIVEEKNSIELVQTYVFTTNLALGDSGEDVYELQKYLNAHGFVVAKSGLGSVGNETYYFGPATESALIAYQKYNNLPAFGFFGPMTRSLINSKEESKEIPIEKKKTSSSRFEFTQNLEQGDTGEDVYELQKYLNAHGFDVAKSGPGSVGNETYYFGFATHNALVEFQKNQGVPHIGFFGPLTRNVMQEK